MLSQLHIENIAVIEEMDLLLGSGLNLLTGETGAGKSVIIDALGAVLGARASGDLLRSGAKRALVSAVFWEPGAAAAGKVAEWFGECDGEEIEVSREILPGGRSAARVNGRPVAASALKELGNLLVRVYGQHDARFLTDESFHLDFIDKFGNLTETLEAYRFRYRNLKRLENECETLKVNANDRLIRLDSLKFAIGEIERADLTPGEDERLRERRKFLRSAGKIRSALETAYVSLYGGDDAEGAYDLLSETASNLSRVSDTGAEPEELAKRAEELMYAAGELSEDVRAMLEELDGDGGELEDVERRLAEIQRLRKYGADADAILSYLERARAESEGIEHSDEKLAALEKELQTAAEETAAAAGKLSRARKKAAAAVEKKLRKELDELDMTKVVIEIDFANTELSVNGAETARFLISANPGEPPKPLSKTASGGELSRVMLALSNVLASDEPTVVFDEIDAGISGFAGMRVAEKLKKIAGERQIICVTHLPQIAAAADSHFHISKETVGERTAARVSELSPEERVSEIARIIGNSSENTRKSVKEMIIRYEKSGK